MFTTGIYPDSSYTMDWLLIVLFLFIPLVGEFGKDVNNMEKLINKTITEKIIKLIVNKTSEILQIDSKRIEEEGGANAVRPVQLLQNLTKNIGKYLKQSNKISVQSSTHEFALHVSLQNKSDIFISSFQTPDTIHMNVSNENTTDHHTSDTISHAFIPSSVFNSTSGNLLQVLVYGSSKLFCDEESLQCPELCTVHCCRCRFSTFTTPT